MAFSTTETWFLKKPGSNCPHRSGLDARCGRASDGGPGWRWTPRTSSALVWPTAATTSSYVYLTYMITGMGKDWVDHDGDFIERDDLRTAFAHYQPASGSPAATPAGLDSNPARQLFWQGNAAMYIDGSWAVAYKNDAGRKRPGRLRRGNLSPSPTRQLARPTCWRCPQGFP